MEKAKAVTDYRAQAEYILRGVILHGETMIDLPALQDRIESAFHICAEEAAAQVAEAREDRNRVVCELLAEKNVLRAQVARLTETLASVHKTYDADAVIARLVEAADHLVKIANVTDSRRQSLRERPVLDALNGLRDALAAVRGGKE